MEAQYHLGCLYTMGEGMALDNREAFRCWRLAAEQGHADAQNNLGVMCEHGLGVEQDKEEAYFWYLLAAAGGSEQGVENRDTLGRELKKAQRKRAEERALGWRGSE